MTSIKMLDVKIFLFGCIKISLPHHVKLNNSDQGDWKRAVIKSMRNYVCEKNKNFDHSFKAIFQCSILNTYHILLIKSETEN